MASISPAAGRIALVADLGALPAHAASRNVPPVPALALETCPAAAREAHRRAVERSDSAQVAGDAAPALHACELWVAATEAPLLQALDTR